MAETTVGGGVADGGSASPATTNRKQPFISGMLVKNPGVPIFLSVFLVTLFVTAALFTGWVDVSSITAQFHQNDILPFEDENIETDDNSAPESCPEYFRWIHEDLKPWKESGITLEMVEKAREKAHFRLMIVDGRLYMEKYDYVFQTRDVFTIWGILQVLKLYPGKVPDLDLMFMCHDWPLIRKEYYPNNSTTIPPLFHYCGDDLTYDIVFPDWSFWGWPEVNVKPWVNLSKELEQGNKKRKWKDREPYAYWKGNTYTGNARRDLAKCNSEQKWNARIHHLDWGKGFKDTDLASQCTHRYKIYVEGNAWSVSEKYILACDSMSLVITPHFYDFFSRGLVPTVHYWPINEHKKCNSIKFAVDWGNKNTKKAQEIGRRGSEFVQNELQMKFVYDYMLHLLIEYSKLFKYRPFITKNAVEVCSCFGKGLVKEFKEISMVVGPSKASPCTMQPPYDKSELQSLLFKKSNLTRQVEIWEESGRI